MKKYQIIYADPPWSYKWGKGGKKAPETHYLTLSIDELCKLPINQISDKNCILVLWVTCPTLPDAFQVMKSWGFNYKTVLHNWIKITKSGVPVTGLGSYTRSASELLLLGMKGHIKRISTKIVISQVLMTQRQEHSKKPDIVRENLVKLFGDLPRIELFAREENDLFNKFEGWDVWGNEVESDIDLQMEK